MRFLIMALLTLGTAAHAQAIINFVFWLHFIKPVFAIDPFDGMRATVLVLVTGAVGFVIGAVFAVIWNALHKT